MLYAPAEIVMDFFDGSCVDVSSVEYSGQPGQLRFFEGSQSGLGANAGILFSTGDALGAIGPNNLSGTSFGYGIVTPDTLLESITTGTTFDLSMLHLKIVPHTDSVGFQYVFGSEEYCEYVGSAFNDAFGFWIKGPGLSDANGAPVNIALIPGTTTPVTINNVNQQTNLTYFRLNDTSSYVQYCGIIGLPVDTTMVNAIQYDGLTTVLTAHAQVVPDSTYDVWIGISDVSDGAWDSGIFLSVQSLCGDSLLAPNADFALQTSGNTVSFENHTKYATAWHWDFGDGSTSEERFPSHTYANLDQQYTVTLLATNYCCSDLSVTTVGVSATGEIGAVEFEISPNPFSDELVIAPADAGLTGQILLTDLSGRVLLSHPFAGKQVLSTQDLPRGVYFLQISTSDGRKMVKKLTK